jgi:ABC-type branched-subunit amino acid transport system substrate-binding protein
MAKAPHRTYDRTWAEIEDMLEQATTKMNEWKAWYEACKDEDDKEGMKEAARNHKALQGVVKTLKWTLGEEGIADPLN